MRDKRLLYLVAALSVPLIGLLDHLTGSEISFSIFYVAPVGVAAMGGRRSASMAAAVACALMWYFVESHSQTYSHPAIAYWNALVRFGFFSIVALALAQLHRQAALTAEMASTDSLTGLANARSFYAALEREVERMGRSGQPLTLAYVDLDDFKKVNDQRGHAAGDELLRVCANALKSNLRLNDTVARLGGDEFAVIFPETSRAVAKSLLSRMRKTLADAVEAFGSPVTMSVGAVTIERKPKAAHDVVRAADALMYRVKAEGKNGLAIETLLVPEAPTHEPA